MTPDLRPPSHLELLLGAAQTAAEQVVLLRRVECLSPAGLAAEQTVVALLDWVRQAHAAAMATAPVRPAAPSVEQHQVQALYESGYLDEAAWGMFDFWPGDPGEVGRIVAEARANGSLPPAAPPVPPAAPAPRHAEPPAASAAPGPSDEPSVDPAAPVAQHESASGEQLPASVSARALVIGGAAPESSEARPADAAPDRRPFPSDARTEGADLAIGTAGLACPACGRMLPAVARFCGWCGRPLARPS